MKRIVIPTEDKEGRIIASHFGRAPNFVVVELDADGQVKDKKTHQNTGVHSGGSGHAHDNVMSYAPDVIIVNGMGPRGIQSFQAHNVSVLRANNLSVETVIQAYLAGQLEELTEGCEDAHHR